MSTWLDGGRRRVDATYDQPDGSMSGTTLLMFASIHGNERLSRDQKCSISIGVYCVGWFHMTIW